MTRTFSIKRYREDFAGLSFQVIAEDSSEVRVMADALDEDDATELAVAMQGLENKFNGAAQ